MKLSYRNRNIILLCIAFLFIGSGIFQIITKIKFDYKISNNIQTGLLLVAGVTFFVGRKNKAEEIKEDKKSTNEEEMK